MAANRSLLIGMKYPGLLHGDMIPRHLVAHAAYWM